VAGYGDYPLTFDVYGRISASYGTDIFLREDGTEKRINLTPLPSRVFEGEHFAITNDERDTLNDFFEAKKGILTTFDFIDPNNEITYTVRFNDPKLEFKRRRDSLWSVSVKLKEIL
jgi:hypothetical protein